MLSAAYISLLWEFPLGLKNYWKPDVNNKNNLHKKYSPSKVAKEHHNMQQNLEQSVD